MALFLSELLCCPVGLKSTNLLCLSWKKLRLFYCVVLEGCAITIVHKDFNMKYLI